MQYLKQHGYSEINMGALGGVTVLLPTFNRPRLLRRAIESVRQQEFCDFVLHVSDNASGSETLELVSELQRLDDRIEYFRHEFNIGPTKNIASMLPRVETDYYCILADDDFLLPGFLRHCREVFEQHPDLDFVCTRTLTINVDEHWARVRNKDWDPGFYSPSPDVVSKMMQSHFTSTGVMFRRRLIEKSGGFHRLGCDMLYLMISAAIGKFYASDFVGAAWLYYRESASGQGGVKSFASRIDILKSVCEDFAFIDANVDSSLQPICADAIIQIYTNHLSVRSVPDATIKARMRAFIKCLALKAGVLVALRNFKNKEGILGLTSQEMEFIRGDRFGIEEFYASILKRMN